jgi:hypothetical protein
MDPLGIAVVLLVFGELIPTAHAFGGGPGRIQRAHTLPASASPAVEIS